MAKLLHVAGRCYTDILDPLSQCSSCKVRSCWAPRFTEYWREQRGRGIVDLLQPGDVSARIGSSQEHAKAWDAANKKVRSEMTFQLVTSA